MSFAWENLARAHKSCFLYYYSCYTVIELAAGILWLLGWTGIRCKKKLAIILQIGKWKQYIGWLTSDCSRAIIVVTKPNAFSYIFFAKRDYRNQFQYGPSPFDVLIASSVLRSDSLLQVFCLPRADHMRLIIVNSQVTKFFNNNWI